ncbi:MAG: universal stress protein [Mycobacteriaceae bacterium]|nr:universal stress protein [Mycobacteriaceae bacterium]
MTSVNPPVVVGVDGSESAARAVRWGAAEAAAHGSPLHLVFGVGEPVDFGAGLGVPPIGDDLFRREGIEAVEAAGRLAEETAASLSAGDITTSVVDAPPIPALTQLSGQARMIVVGTRGLGAFRRGLLGSVSTAVAREASCPVAVIPDGELRRSGPVVVGVDGSPADQAAVDIAFDEAAHREAELIALHAATWIGMQSNWQIQTEGSVLISETLAGRRERYPEVRTRRIVVEEEPAKGLLAAAHNAQLVVVGTHNPSRIIEWLCGSTAQNVIHHADCPIIVAQPGE